jgi:hypothetical protein
MGIQSLYRKGVGDKMKESDQKIKEIIGELEALVSRLKSEHLRSEFGLDDPDHTKGLGYEDLQDDDGYTD